MLQGLNECQKNAHHKPVLNDAVSKNCFGVPVVVQWLMNPTRNHAVAGSIPALAQWVKNPTLP